MLNLDLEAARAGMVLGQDIVGRQGQVLLRAGVILSDKLLQVLRANQIQTVQIGPDPASTPTARLDATAIEAQLEERFRLSDAGHPLIQELRRLCHKRLIGHGIEQQEGADSD